MDREGDVTNRGTKTAAMRLKELEIGRLLEEFIRSEVEAGCTDQETAARLGVARSTYLVWKARLGTRTFKTVAFESELAGAGR
jgi:transposase